MENSSGPWTGMALRSSLALPNPTGSLGSWNAQDTAGREDRGSFEVRQHHLGAGVGSFTAGGFERTEHDEVPPWACSHAGRLRTSSPPPRRSSRHTDPFGELSTGRTRRDLQPSDGDSVLRSELLARRQGFPGTEEDPRRPSPPFLGVRLRR